MVALLASISFLLNPPKEYPQSRATFCQEQFRKRSNVFYPIQIEVDLGISLSAVMPTTNLICPKPVTNKRAILL